MKQLKRSLFFLLSLLGGMAGGQAQSYEAYVERGLQLAAQDSLMQAVSAFREALRISPNDHRNALVWTNLGRCAEAIYWRNTKDKKIGDEALEAYTMAVNLAPTAVPILEARANCYFNLGIWNKAISDYSVILDLNPTNLAARQHRAFSYQERRLWTEAVNDYNRILEAEPGNYAASLGLAVIDQKRGNLQQAINRITAMIDTGEKRAELYSLRAGMLAENKQEELALLDLDEAIRQEPDNANYLLARAYLHKQRGSAFLARRDFERAYDCGAQSTLVLKEIRDLK
jgi:tetratricopeptide (TPR) repeat protein